MSGSGTSAQTRSNRYEIFSGSQDFTLYSYMSPAHYLRAGWIFIQREAKILLRIHAWGKDSLRLISAPGITHR